MHCCMKENFFAFSLQVKNNELKYILKHKFTMWQKIGNEIFWAEDKLHLCANKGFHFLMN